MCLFGTQHARSTGDQSMVAMAWVAIIGVGVLGGLALLDRRTRVTGAFALLVAAICNPVIIGVALVAVGQAT